MNSVPALKREQEEAIKMESRTVQALLDTSKMGPLEERLVDFTLGTTFND